MMPLWLEWRRVLGAALDDTGTGIGGHRGARGPPGVLGAVGENGIRNLDAGLAARFGIGPETLAREAQRLEADLVKHRQALRAHMPEQPLAGRTVLLVDDGVARATRRVELGSVGQGPCRGRRVDTASTLLWTKF